MHYDGWGVGLAGQLQQPGRDLRAPIEVNNCMLLVAIPDIGSAAPSACCAGVACTGTPNTCSAACAYVFMPFYAGCADYAATHLPRK